MEKRVYAKPVLESETFVPQCYCKNCAAEPGITKYYFECNAGSKNNQYAIKDSRGKVATISGKYMDGKWHYYHPCGETHIAYSNSGFLTGYHLDDPDTKKDENIAVTIWTEYGRDVHCTTELDMEHWETVKS